MSQERTDRFYEWEARGRGVMKWDYKVFPEPPYVPFKTSTANVWNDDSLSEEEGCLYFLIKPFVTKKELPKEESETLEEPNPQEYPFGYDVIELELTPPQGKDISLNTFEQCLVSMPHRYPMTWEIVATGTSIKYLLVVIKEEHQMIVRHLNAFLPELRITIHEEYVYAATNDIGTDTTQFGSVEFALENEFMLPMATMDKKSSSVDPLTTYLSIVHTAGENEVFTLQVIFEPVHAPWARDMVASVSSGKESYFVNAPHMPKLAYEKSSHPLYAVVVRMYAFADSQARLDYFGNAARSLAKITKSPHNALTWLEEEPEEDERDPEMVEIEKFLFGEDIEGIEMAEEAYGEFLRKVLHRSTNRSGMILNIKELLTLVHLPSSSLRLKKLQTDTGKSKGVIPPLTYAPLQLGINTHQGQEKPVTLSSEQRLRHTHIIGGTGTGKSTLIESMIVQDINNGDGLMLLDPHGDLVESILTRIPPSRVNDVVVIDPGDTEYSTGFNLLSAKTDIEKIILSSDLVAMFKRLSASWGDQMNSVFGNAIAAMLEGRGGTLLDLRRFLAEPKFRNGYLKTVTEPSVVYYWEKEFPLLRKNSTAPIITRLDVFLRPNIIRNMMGQQRGVEVRELVQKGKIVLVKLAQGLIGKENSYLLGTQFVAKLNQVIKARQSIDKSERNPFYLYIDEFQNFITPSMEDILSGARKYGLGLILAHQGLTQLAKADKGVHDSVIANAGNRIVFRVGYSDAKILEKDFSYFQEEDLQNLGLGQAIVRIGRRDQDYNIQTQRLPELDPQTAKKIALQALSTSRKNYARPQKEVEAEIQEIYFNTITSGNDIPPQFQTKTITKEHPTPIETPLVIAAPEESNQEYTTEDLPDFEQEAEDFKKQEVEREEKRQHVYLQSLLKKIAEARGFKAVIEEPTKNNGRVDVGLTKDDLRIAIEISVTTSAALELKNIQKCIGAGYAHVISVSKKTNQLKKIRELAQAKLSAIEFNKVQFLSPDEATTFLDSFFTPEEPKENIVKGYRVKVNVKKKKEQ